MLKSRVVLASILISSLFLVACIPSSEKPKTQQNFTKTMWDTFMAYNRGDTDAQKKEVREKAVASRVAYLAAIETNFSGWICKVDNVNTKDGPNDRFTRKTIAIVTLDCGGFTFYNADITRLRSVENESQGVPANAIIKGTPLFDTASALKKGYYVKASGNFIKKDSGEIHEKSLTKFGAMLHPEFVVHFSELEPTI